MTLEELLNRHAYTPGSSVPDWMLGCFRRHCISFANGESDTTTLVFWFQSRNFTIDLRLPRPSERLPAKSLQGCTPEELQVLANYEGWAAQSHWDGQYMAWYGETSLQLHNRWPEPAELRRVGNCMMEFAPSGAYVEDWRLQPSGPGPLVGLQLLEERNRTTGTQLHQGGGLIICGDFAALVRGRPEPVDNTVESLPDAVSQASSAEELTNLLGVETSVARGSLASGYIVQHSTQAARIGQPLLALNDAHWALDGTQLLQVVEEDGQVIERRFEIDVLCATHDFPQTSPMTDTAQAWFNREAPTLTRYTTALSNVDLFKPLNLGGFRAPELWQGDRVVLIPASPRWAEADLAAVRSSRPQLRNLFGPDDNWPPADLSLADDTADLAWHAEEFAAGRSFAYHLLNPERTQCVGCLYLYPTASLAHDGEAYLWTRSDLDREQARAMEQEVLGWVDTEWPFTALAWPGRGLSFADWRRYQAPNYYGAMRFAEPFTPN